MFDFFSSLYSNFVFICISCVCVFYTYIYIYIILHFKVMDTGSLTLPIVSG